MATLKIKKLDKNAIAPKYSRKGDSGMDLHSLVTVALEPWGRVKVPTGIAIELLEGQEAQVRPRSGLFAKHGVMAALGTIDSTYRGELQVVLFNLSDEPFCFFSGDRIAQLVIAEVSTVEIVEVEELSESVRGDQGFGSSGV